MDICVFWATMLNYPQPRPMKPLPTEFGMQDGFPSRRVASPFFGSLKSSKENAEPPETHSHSIVAGGLLEMSYTTRFTPRTSLMMRLLITASTS